MKFAKLTKRNDTPVYIAPKLVSAIEVDGTFTTIQLRGHGNPYYIVQETPAVAAATIEAASIEG